MEIGAYEAVTGSVLVLLVLDRFVTVVRTMKNGNTNPHSTNGVLNTKLDSLIDLGQETNKGIQSMNEKLAAISAKECPVLRRPGKD